MWVWNFGILSYERHFGKEGQSEAVLLHGELVNVLGKTTELVLHRQACTCCPFWPCSLISYHCYLFIFLNLSFCSPNFRGFRLSLEAEGISANTNYYSC